MDDKERCPEPKRFMLYSAAAVLLAMAAVLLGLTLHDGLGDWDMHRVWRKYQRALPWALPLAAAFGAFLHRVYDSLLEAEPKPSWMGFAVLRAFLTFPLYGCIALFCFMYLLFNGFRLMIVRKRRGEKPHQDGDEEIARRIMGPPLWMMLFPFAVLKVPLDGEEEGDISVPAVIPPSYMLKWLIWPLLGVMMFTGAVSEETGERVDPHWLAALATAWFADYLCATQLVAPVMIARRARERADAKTDA